METNTRDDAIADTVKDLRHDGDTVSLGDGRTLRLRIEHDPDTSLNDYDCYGRTERYSHRYSFGEQRTPRPDDMDGSARKIEADQGYWIWWQPSDDMKSAKAWGGDPAEYPAVFRRYVDQVTDLLRYGFSQVGLELLETLTDSLGNEHVVTVDSAWCGGVDDVDSDYLGEILRDLGDQVLPR